MTFSKQLATPALVAAGNCPVTINPSGASGEPLDDIETADLSHATPKAPELCGAVRPLVKLAIRDLKDGAGLETRC